MVRSRHYVIGISGASGIILGFKVIRAILEHCIEAHVHCIITRDARYTAFEEIGKSYRNKESILAEFSAELHSRISIYEVGDFSAPIASGTFVTEGMAIVPCSMATLAAVACGLSDTLLRRAADVTLKERRKLIIVPREAPFSSLHLENMLSLSKIGAIILSPQPAWYMKPKTIEDVEAHIVGRILDMFQLYTNYPRWGNP